VKVRNAARFRTVLPLPAFVLHPLTALIIAAVHVYLAGGHLLKLFGGEVTWTNIWKGFGALAGAYVFAAVASRRPAQNTKVLPFGLDHKEKRNGTTNSSAMRSHL
jgi:hypothetical protein